MRIPVITIDGIAPALRGGTMATALIWCALATTVAAQASSSPVAPVANSASQAPATKAQLTAIRALVRELQLRTETLHDFLAQHRSLVERLPSEPGGNSDEANKAHEQQLNSWSTSLERLLRRMDGARAAVADAEQRLTASLTNRLPTALNADVETARREAAAERSGAEEALAANKPEPARAEKSAKPTKSAKTAKAAKTAQPAEPAPPVRYSGLNAP